jgi:hypothetical protein
MKTSESINELAKALAAAQGEMGHAVLNKINPHFKSKYADLAEIINATKILAKHGIAVVQGTSMREWGLACVTRFMHSSGQWMESEYPLPMAPDKPQIMASAYTYARRYGRAGMSGIAAEEDDDGNHATKGNGAAEKPTYPNSKSRDPYFKLETTLRAHSSLDDLDAWWQKKETLELRSRLPMTWQIELFISFMKHGFKIAESKQAQAVFAGTYRNDFKGIVDEDARHDLLETYRECQAAWPNEMEAT